MEYKLNYPIAIFAYDRLEPLKETIKCLKKNPEAKKSQIYIFCDGPKFHNSENVRRVREYVKNLTGFKSIECIFHEVNFGLEKSIVKGVSTVLEKHQGIIVLEDDIATSPFFLKYMNDALNYYENDEYVMHVSGYFDPVDTSLLKQDTFFYPTASCWGWGTWKSSWEHYCSNAKYLHDELARKKLMKAFDLNGTDVFRSQLLDNVYGVKSTWAIKWMASIFLLGGYCLHPRKSLTRNIGFDCDATNTKSMISSYVFQGCYDGKIEIYEIKRHNSEYITRKMRRFYLTNGCDNPVIMAFIFFGKKIKRIIRDIKRLCYGF